MNQTVPETLHRFAVSYSIPTAHHVVVGVEAPSPDAAISRVREAFDALTLWDDTPEMPLLEDEYVEEATCGDRLALGATRIDGDFESDPSVIEIRQEKAAVRACELLVIAYQRGEDRHGSIEWDDVDEAYRAALVATGAVESKAIESSPAAPVTLGTIDPQHLAVEALDAACALIQARLGVTSGDLAGIFFSGSEVEAILAAYVRSEIAVQTGETPRQLDPLSYRREVPAAELDRPQVLSVNLRSCGNIDMGQDPDRPLFGVPTMPAHRVGSLRAAGQACRAYIERHGLGSSQWSGGWVRDGGSAIVAHVSYNGRVWFPNET